MSQSLIVAFFITLIGVEWIASWTGLARADFNRNVVLTAISLANIPLVATGAVGALLVTQPRKSGKTLVIMANLGTGLLWIIGAATIIPFANPLGWKGVIGPNVVMALMWLGSAALLLLGGKAAAQEESATAAQTELATPIMDGVARSRRALAETKLDYATTQKIRTLLGRAESIPRSRLNGEKGLALQQQMDGLATLIRSAADESSLNSAMADLDHSINALR